MPSQLYKLFAFSQAPQDGLYIKNEPQIISLVAPYLTLLSPDMHSTEPAAMMTQDSQICANAAVVFVPAKTPVKLEATDDGLDVWVAAVNTQVFQGEANSARHVKSTRCSFR